MPGQKLSENGGAAQIIPPDSPQLAVLFQQKALAAAWMQETWGTRLIQEQIAARIEANTAASVAPLNAEIKRLTGRGLTDSVIAESLKRITFTGDPFPETLQTQADRSFTLGFLGRTKPDMTGLADD